MKNRTLSNLGNWLDSTKAKKARSLRSVNSSEEFSALLKRERALADRHGLAFSVLAFAVSKPGAPDELLEHLVQVIARRIRATDEMGFFDHRRLGVLLPCTSPEGAWKIAEDISRQVWDAIPSLTCRVYTYPYHWLADEEEISSQLRPEIGAPLTLESSETDKGDGEVLADFSTAPTPEKCTHGLEHIFAQPLPFWKRLMDIAGSLFGLILLLPILLPTAIFIKLSSPGPVFFKQKRVGRSGKLFTCYKFRTMKVNCSTSNHQQYLKQLINSDQAMKKLDDQDKQIIFLGRFLRKASIDELPQLINVLKGDMSLIGPRPCLPYEAKEFLPWHTNRFNVTPGMTGLWQVNGKNQTTFKEMIRYDIAYANLCSLGLDIKILFKTFPAILNQISDKIKISARG